MESIGFRSSWPVRLGVGRIAGAAIAYVGKVAFGGEVSPIAVLAMLLATMATAGAIWGPRGWVTTVTASAFVPLPHSVKHLLGLLDTLYPNTYATILRLAAFSLVVAAVGTGCGMLVRKLACAGAHSDSGPA